MPEGDTVFVAARRLHDALAGRVLTKTDFRVPRFATADLSGQTVTEVVARGKHLLLRTDAGWTLHSHLDMEGEWHVYTREQRWRLPAHHARVVLETQNARAVGFRLGIAELLRTSNESDAVGHLGPDLLGPDWDATEAERRLSLDAARPIAEAITDQRVMAGLGNVYKSEVCFLAGADPSTPAGDVDAAKFVGIAKRVIEANRLRGSQITTGDTRPGRRHWVYGRGGEPCRRCGTRIAFDRMQDRVTYWCPSCQPALNVRARGTTAPRA
jgi:endonuclease-8